ncbi:hypothetical protein P8864_11475 [Priestia flexa]|nr:hypothetical protein [Priestia flexa]MEC0666507.1 hypothetical protein [Priestia flexa]
MSRDVHCRLLAFHGARAELPRHCVPAGSQLLASHVGVFPSRDFESVGG